MKQLTPKQRAVLGRISASCGGVGGITYANEIPGLTKSMRDRLEALGRIHCGGLERYDGSPEDRKVVVTLLDGAA